MYTTAEMNFHTEDEFVRWLRVFSSGRSRHVAVGIGDDAAVVRIREGRDLILTADLSIEGVHFTTRLHPARSVGHRALARSLSDIAAMGGVPRFALISAAFTKVAPKDWVQEFFRGVFELASRYRVEVIGGDTSIVRQKAMVDVTLAGEVDRGRGLLRSGARSGDHIFVSGTLGQSALGLKILKSRGRGRKRSAKVEKGDLHIAPPIQSHLYPEPRCELGRWLQKAGIPSAMMDISDGLSTDLVRLCEASGVGARIYSDRIPVPTGVNPRRSLELALNGGEDYELLFAVAERKLAKLPRQHRGVPLHRIGRILPSREIRIVHSDGTEAPLAPSGYDHFSK